MPALLDPTEALQPQQPVPLSSKCALQYLTGMVAATPCDEEFFLRVINAFLFAYTSFVESFRKL